MNNEFVNKLILLFILDKAETPLKDETILDMCGNKNNWVAYMDCITALASLEEGGFVINTTKSSNMRVYIITTDGRDCLSHFYTKIPLSIRDEITSHIKDNLLNYRQKQEYFSDYYKNDDGTHTVMLKIAVPGQQPLLDLKLIVPNRNAARWIYKNWNEKAPELYELVYDLLIE